MPPLIFSALLLFMLFALVLFTGMPFAFAMGISALIVLVLGFNLPITMLINVASSKVESWIWLAIPLFLSLGLLMTASGVTERLINVAQSLAGHIQGGLSHVVVITNMLMAGMSGSYLADAATTGAILIPPLKKAGYSRGYASAITACAAITGPLIPPSLNLIICGVLVETSILKLWIGGIVPGILVGSVLLITGYIMAGKRGYPIKKWKGFKRLGRDTFIALPALVIPIVILGGMRLGIFTPTEAGASGVVYLLLVAFFVYRKMKVGQLRAPMTEVIRTTGAILFILAMSGIISLVISITQSGIFIAELLMSITDNPIAFLFIVASFLLIAGMFVDGIALMLIFIPILLPAVHAYGIDLIHFGLVFSFCILLGGLTPPYGLGMFVTNGISGATVGEYCRDGWLLILSCISLVIPLILFPPLTTWLPTVFMGR